MTTQEKLIRKKQSLIELAEYLQNVSQACKINGVSRQHFYDILNDRVLPFFEGQDIPVLRVLTDRGTEYCGAFLLV